MHANLSFTVFVIAALEMSMSAPSAAESRVDFSYAFATPHRLTAGRPDNSDRTLLDLQPGSLRMAWTYEDLTHFPLGAFVTPRTSWDVRITPQVDGHPFAQSRWTRLDGWLPALDNAYEDTVTSARLEVIGGRDGGAHPVLGCQHGLEGAPGRPPLRIGELGREPGLGRPGTLGWATTWSRAGMTGRIGFSFSAWARTLTRSRATAKPPARNPYPGVEPQPGQKRAGWVVRPYRAYAADLPALRSHDWAKEFDAGEKEWQDLLGRASRVTIPDRGVENAFHACLADLFIMREPVAGGYVAAVPGHGGATAPAECVRGGHRRRGHRPGGAAPGSGQRLPASDLDIQEPDGNWADRKGWGHLMWGDSGFKAWAAMEHYRLTRDPAFLERALPRTWLASSRWQEAERARTRVMDGKGRPLAYGLMPRGMGDAGLMNDGDLYGIFIPHNIWAVYADRLSVEAAEALGKKRDIKELQRIYETGRDDLLQAIERGAIREKEYRWIPGVPGKTSGSRWGVLNAALPVRPVARRPRADRRHAPPHRGAPQQGRHPHPHGLDGRRDVGGDHARQCGRGPPGARQRRCRRPLSLRDTQPRHAALHVVRGARPGARHGPMLGRSPAPLDPRCGRPVPPRLPCDGGRGRPPPRARHRP